MLDDIQSDAKHRMDQAVEHTRMELVKIRTGRANPEVLHSVTVDYYGTKTPLNQISNITVPEARLITIQPFEKHLIPEIEKAIMDSNIGLTPNNNGTAIHHVRDYGKEEHISEDEIRRVEQDMQAMSDKHVESLNTLQEHKEKELMEF